jgi:hypothetical protein
MNKSETVGVVVVPRNVVQFAAWALRRSEYLECARALEAALAAPPAAPSDDVALLRALVAELADEVEADVNDEYPATQREQYAFARARYDRDMDVVRRARSALASRPA